MSKWKVPMLAQDFKEGRVKFPCYAEPKFDGVRVLAEITRGNQNAMTVDEVNFYFRSGKPVHTLEHLAEPLLKISEGWGDCWFDGEVIHEEGFMKCVGDVRRKRLQAPHLTYAIFDVFSDQRPHLSYLERRKILNDIPFGTGGKIEVVPTKSICKMDDLWEAKEIYEAMSDNVEGVMVKSSDALYQHGKRSFDWMKVKDELSVDFPVVEAYEGTGKYVEMLGGFIAENPNTGARVRIGGGYTDEQRKQYWDNRNEYIGVVAEIKYQYMTPKGSLRHPIFKCWRIDK
jgi:ATP-dependent DNA ligase